MTVQSARVQQIIKGDDVTLTHQLMKSVAYNAELTRAPDPLATGDVVDFFYPLQDPTKTDLVGYRGVPVGSLPASLFTVAIPSNVPAVTGVSDQRGTGTFESGEGQTVRAQITRLVATVTGNTSNGSPTITSISDMTGLLVGQSVAGSGVPSGAIIVALGINAVTLSANATATASGVTLTIGRKETQYLIREVDILERGFPVSLDDPSGGTNPPQPSLNLP